jgi:enterochelin esterase-like enzyme
VERYRNLIAHKVQHLVVLALLAGFLSGCAGIEVEGASNLPTVVSPTLEQVAETPVPAENKLVHTSTPVPQPTFTPAPLPLPTSTPFYCAYLRGRTESVSLISESIGEEVRISVHLPPCYDDYQTKAFPVLYLLHGWPLDERHWDFLGIDELADDWIIRQIAGPFLIVMPGVRSDGLYVNSSGGSWSFEGMLADELVPLIDQNYRTWRDPAGRAIGGISRGGVWALEIAFRHQDLFSIVGGHSPALALNRPLPQYDPFLLIRDGVAGMRIYLDAGSLDWARSSTLRLYDALVEAAADVTYQIHEGGHVDALWQGGIVDYADFYTLTWPDSFETLPFWEAIPVESPAAQTP